MSGSPASPRVSILGNPASGRGRGDAAIRKLEALLRDRGVEALCLRTERPGHGVELARAAAGAGTDVLLAVGGDGTLRDVAQGLFQAGALDRVAVCLSPAGTGNDLARTIPVPATADEAVEAALGTRERRLDVWTWGEDVFVNVAGVGLDAAVALEVNRSFRWLHGLPAYLAAFARVLPGFRPLKLSLKWDTGEWSGEAWLAAFGNARCYGGGMQITPNAVPDDGLLDVLVVEALPKLQLLAQFPRIFRGTHVAHPRVREFRVSRVEVQVPPQAVTLDGEVIGATPAVVTRAAGRLRLRLPARP